MKIDPQSFLLFLTSSSSSDSKTSALIHDFLEYADNPGKPYDSKTDEKTDSGDSTIRTFTQQLQTIINAWGGEPGEVSSSSSSSSIYSCLISEPFFYFANYTGTPHNYILPPSLPLSLHLPLQNFPISRRLPRLPTNTRAESTPHKQSAAAALQLLHELTPGGRQGVEALD